jgi:hypothetical protein
MIGAWRPQSFSSIAAAPDCALQPIDPLMRNSRDHGRVIGTLIADSIFSIDDAPLKNGESVLAGKESSRCYERCARDVDCLASDAACLNRNDRTFAASECRERRIIPQ